MDAPMGLAVLQDGAEPVTLSEAKLHCRCDHNDEDSLFALWIKAARRYVEQATGRVLTTRQLQLTLDAFPPSQIELPRSPVTAIGEVGYVDPNGDEQIVDPALYQADLNTHRPRLSPAPATSWPATRAQYAAVWVTFQAGGQRETLKAAMLLLVGHWYANREAVASGTLTEVPAGVDALLALEWDGAYAW